jgi:hypothetical protein
MKFSQRSMSLDKCLTTCGTDLTPVSQQRDVQVQQVQVALGGDIVSASQLLIEALRHTRHSLPHASDMVVQVFKMMHDMNMHLTFQRLCAAPVFRLTWWISTQVAVTASLTDSPPSAWSARKRVATEWRASAGQSLNQSMVQQLMRDGNWRHLVIRTQ